jgi:hypothetical protein
MSSSSLHTTVPRLGHDRRLFYDASHSTFLLARPSFAYARVDAVQQQPISAVGAAAGLVAGVGLGVVDGALDVVDGGVSVSEGAGGMVVEGADAINP